MKLYKRNAQGKPIVWEINKLNNALEIKSGLVGGNLHTECITITKTKADEYKSRINAKRKEGYKELSELKDNISCNDLNDNTLQNFLNTYLPKHNTTSKGFVLPMLAKTLEDNKPFEKYGSFIGQWKINGLRCLIGAKKDYSNLFNSITLTYHSREGEDWTSSMSWMDDIILPKLTNNLLYMMIEEGAYLDGELYLPGYSVNTINSLVKNTQLFQHYQLQYWCYDIACENISVISRNDIRVKGFSNSKDYNTFITSFTINSKDDHFNNTERLILLPNFEINNIADAIDIRDKFINLGFEGLILRNPNAEYQFGKRNQSMFKFKKIYDGLFDIIDIKKDKRGLPIFILKNDINAEYFECTYNAPHTEQEKYISTPLKEDLIIHYKAFVEYRERSGIKEVPFHAKIIHFEGYDNKFK